MAVIGRYCGGKRSLMINSHGDSGQKRAKLTALPHGYTVGKFI